jgi:hypothetical protein
MAAARLAGSLRSGAGDGTRGTTGSRTIPGASMMLDSPTRWVMWAGLLFAVASLAFGFTMGLRFLTVLGFASALVGLVRPLAGFLGVGLLCTLDAVMRVYLFTGGLFRWNLFNYLLLVAMALAAPRLIRRNDPHGRLLQVLLLVLILGLAWSLDRTLGLLHILAASIYFGILRYLLPFASAPNAWYWLGLINGTVAAIGGAVFFLQRKGLPPIDANALSYFPLTGLLSCALAYRFVPNSGPRARLLERLAIGNAYWVFLTGSRGGLLVAVFGLGWLVTQISGRRARLAFFGWVLLLGCLILPAFRDAGHPFERLSWSLDPSYTVSERTTGRSELVLAAWRVFRERPFGIGTGSFPKTWARLSGDPASDGRYARGLERDAHSAWFKVLAENGFVGELLLLAFVFSFAAVGWMRRHQRRGVLALGVLATGSLSLAFATTQFQGKGLWLLAAGVAALLHADDADEPAGG